MTHTLEKLAGFVPVQTERPAWGHHLDWGSVFNVISQFSDGREGFAKAWHTNYSDRGFDNHSYTESEEEFMSAAIEVINSFPGEEKYRVLLDIADSTVPNDDEADSPHGHDHFANFGWRAFDCIREAAKTIRTLKDDSLVDVLVRTLLYDGKLENSGSSYGLNSYTVEVLFDRQSAISNPDGRVDSHLALAFLCYMAGYEHTLKGREVYPYDRQNEAFWFLGANTGILEKESLALVEKARSGQDVSKEVKSFKTHLDIARARFPHRALDPSLFERMDRSYSEMSASLVSVGK
jgi:hypothetical protein